MTFRPNLIETLRGNIILSFFMPTNNYYLSFLKVLVKKGMGKFHDLTNELRLEFETDREIEIFLQSIARNNHGIWTWDRDTTISRNLIFNVQINGNGLEFYQAHKWDYFKPILSFRNGIFAFITVLIPSLTYLQHNEAKTLQSNRKTPSVKEEPKLPAISKPNKSQTKKLNDTAVHIIKSVQVPKK